MSIKILLTHPCGYPSKIRLLTNLQSGNKEQIHRHVNWICAECLLSSDCGWLSYYASCYVDIGDVIGWLCDVIIHLGIGENFAIRKKTHPESRQSLKGGEIHMTHMETCLRPCAMHQTGSALTKMSFRARRWNDLSTFMDRTCLRTSTWSNTGSIFSSKCIVLDAPKPFNPPIPAQFCPPYPSPIFPLLFF